MKILEAVIAAAATIAAILYMYRVRETVPAGERREGPLTKREKSYVLLMIILAPLVAGAIFYYGWIKRLPGKARQANRWSIIVALVLIALSMALVGLT